METVDSLKMRMSLRLLIPAVNFHVLHNKKELRYCSISAFLLIKVSVNNNFTSKSSLMKKVK